MVSVGLAISALFLLGTVFMMASAQPEDIPPGLGTPPDVGGAETDGKQPTDGSVCKPPATYNQMSVSQRCQNEFFDCIKREEHFCVWQ